MADSPKRSSVADSRCKSFLTTHWSVVLAAGQAGSPASRQALSTLCESYWYPMYAYVRRRGYRVEEARDLTQEFFTRLLEKDYLGMVDRQKGKFRSFLLAMFNHFLANEWRRAHAGKRGGGRTTLSLDFQMGERRYSEEPSHELTPERIYERRWAFTLLEQALATLREEYVRSGKGALFEYLKPYLGGNPGTMPYEEAAAALDMSEGAVKVAVHRLRRRCREVLRAEIAQTVAGPEEVEEELRDLFHAVSR